MDIVERLREGKSAGGYWREKEAADEIERLRKDYALAWENHLLHEQIFVLTEAKIERLQEALQQIADKNPFPINSVPVNDLQYYAQVIVDMVTIANAALKESE